MVTKEELEGFLDRLSAEGASYREVEPGLWVVKPGGELDFDLVVNYTPPVVLMRVKVMTLPKDEAELATLSRRLLELNASDLVHGSYGIEEDSIVMTEALELSHLDYEEFQAAFESIAIALASHLREIGSFNARPSQPPRPARVARTSAKSTKSQKSAAKSGNSAKGRAGRRR